LVGIIVNGYLDTNGNSIISIKVIDLSFSGNAFDYGRSTVFLCRLLVRNVVHNTWMKKILLLRQRIKNPFIMHYDPIKDIFASILRKFPFYLFIQLLEFNVRKNSWYVRRELLR